MQDVYWHDLLFDSRNINSMDHCGSTDFELTPFSQNIVSHESNIHSAGTSGADMRIENHDMTNSLGTTSPSPIRRLASLGVSLSECAERLPSMTANGMGGSRKTRILAVDELFRLTTEFIDVLRCISIVECETNSAFSTIDPKHMNAQLPLALAGNS